MNTKEEIQGLKVGDKLLVRERNGSTVQTIKGITKTLLVTDKEVRFRRENLSEYGGSVWYPRSASVATEDSIKQYSREKERLRLFTVAKTLPLQKCTSEELTGLIRFSLELGGIKRALSEYKSVNSDFIANVESLGIVSGKQTLEPSKRGELTPEAEELIKSLGVKDATTTKLRLLPYLICVMTNSKKPNRDFLNGDDNAFLAELRDLGHLGGTFEDGFKISKKLWDVSNSLLWLAYVNNGCDMMPESDA